MRRIGLIVAAVAVLAASSACIDDPERDDAGRLVLSDDFNEAISSSSDPASVMADVILTGTLPEDTEVDGLPSTPRARLGFFLTGVTSLPGELHLGDLLSADQKLEPLVIPALAKAEKPMPGHEMTGVSEALMQLAPQIRTTLRDGSDTERGEAQDALASVFADNEDDQVIDEFERRLEDEMQEAIEDELDSLDPRASAAEVDQVVTSLGRDWITPTAQAVGASYRTFCKNRPDKCDDVAFNGRVDLFQRQSLVPLFTNLPKSSLPPVLREPELLGDYPPRDSEQEDVWTKYLLERGLSPLTDLYEAAGREPT